MREAAPLRVALRIDSLNLGSARTIRIGGRSVLTGIGKAAAMGAVAVARLGLAGDEQADLSIHGGLDKAVYAYPAEHYAFWQAERLARGVSLFDEALPPGFLGENLTVRGLLEHEVYVGDRLHFPDCLLRVSAPREPCFKLNAVMGFAQAGRSMAIAGCCGYYLSVVEPGSLAAGQEAWLEPGLRSLSIAAAFAGKFAKHVR